MLELADEETFPKEGSSALSSSIINADYCLRGDLRRRGRSQLMACGAAQIHDAEKSIDMNLILRPGICSISRQPTNQSAR